MSSDEDVAFDNWEEAAEQLEKEEQVKKQETVNEQVKQQEIPDSVNQQKKTEKPVQLDPKQLLKLKIKSYQKMTVQQFQACSDDITENNKNAGAKIGNPVLKSDKDFNNYAKILAKRFDNIVQNQDATIDQDKLSLFFEQLTLYMYKNLEWKSLHDVQAKLKVVKKQRKAEEDKKKKQKEKDERLKKAQIEGGSESKSQSINNQQKKEEDLFGGVSNITSKQEQEERKNKIITEAAKKQQKQEEQDDDDFM